MTRPRSGLEPGTLPGGRYLRARLRGEPPEVYERIGPTFATLVKAARPDSPGPSSAAIVTRRRTPTRRRLASGDGLAHRLRNLPMISLRALRCRRRRRRKRQRAAGTRRVHQPGHARARQTLPRRRDLQEKRDHSARTCPPVPPLLPSFSSEMAAEIGSNGTPARAYASRTSSGGRLEDTKERLVVRDERRAHVADWLSFSLQLENGVADLRGVTPQLHEGLPALPPAASACAASVQETGFAPTGGEEDFQYWKCRLQMPCVAWKASAPRSTHCRDRRTPRRPCARRHPPTWRTPPASPDRRRARSGAPVRGSPSSDRSRAEAPSTRRARLPTG